MIIYEYVSPWDDVVEGVEKHTLPAKATEVGFEPFLFVLFTNKTALCQNPIRYLFGDEKTRPSRLVVDFFEAN